MGEAPLVEGDLSARCRPDRRVRAGDRTIVDRDVVECNVVVALRDRVGAHSPKQLAKVAVSTVEGVEGDRNELDIATVRRPFAVANAERRTVGGFATSV